MATRFFNEGDVASRLSYGPVRRSQVPVVALVRLRYLKEAYTKFIRSGRIRTFR